VNDAASISAAARRYALVILAIVYMFNFIDRQILGILLPAIRDEFGVSDTWLGFLSGTAFAMFYIVLGIPVARYADRQNRRDLIAFAVALWSGMTALCGVAANFWQLALARIGVGVGEAGCSPPAHSMIADLYPPEQRSTAMGVYTIGISVGIMLAYLLGGWVVQNIGWREAFLIVGLPGILLALVVRFTVVEPPRGHAEGREALAAQPPFLETIGDRLSPGGSLHVATDWENYAEHIEEMVRESGRFECAEKRVHAGDEPLDRPGTKFERRGLRRGHRIWDWRFVRAA
jgi:MFS family permease